MIIDLPIRMLFLFIMYAMLLQDEHNLLCQLDDIQYMVQILSLDSVNDLLVKIVDVQLGTWIIPKH